MRLHLNENTAGCSPAVLEALRRVGREDAGLYPDIEPATRAVATYYGVDPASLLLTNGLDEGILATLAAVFRGRGGGVPEALGVRPAFDMYDILATGLGGRWITVPMPRDFSLPVDELLASVSPDTRVAIVTNPHNPSGAVTPRETLVDLARRLAPLPLFVDEAYAEFSDQSLLDPATLEALPNLIVGRTFSKAYGLAGLRCGALVASPATLEPIRPIVPPYNVNAFAVAALPAAVTDTEYRDWYVAQVKQSRRVLGAACERLGLRTWPSATNFLLVHVGASAPSIVAALAARGVLVRDRSREEGCEGCIRVTAGLTADTERAVAALEEALCDAR